MKSWTKLSAIQKREAIALRLGWRMMISSTKEYLGWEMPNGSFAGKVPNWPTNDGLAFAEVWNNLCITLKANGRTPMLYPTRSGSCGLEIDVDESGEPEDVITGPTWADAICHAAYILLKVPK